MEKTRNTSSADLLSINQSGHRKLIDHISAIDTIPWNFPGKKIIGQEARRQAGRQKAGSTNLGLARTTSPISSQRSPAANIVKCFIPISPEPSRRARQKGERAKPRHIIFSRSASRSADDQPDWT